MRGPRTAPDPPGTRRSGRRLAKPPGAGDNGVVPRLTDEQVTEGLTALPGWERTGDTIVKTFECATFPAAIGFVVALADEAESANHHPDIDIRWRKVRIALTTHDEGGISEKDLALAREIERLAEAGP